MNLSLKQYRAIDLGLMLLILTGAEALIAHAARSWFPDEIYVLSPTMALVCIVMMRWGGRRWALSRNSTQSTARAPASH